MISLWTEDQSSMQQMGIHNKFVVNLSTFLDIKLNQPVKVELTITELEQLVSWMEGSFSSEEQAIKDTANYFHIQLHMKQVWKDRTDGIWLYVEQAVADSAERPYRQRFYRVIKEKKGTFSSEVYEISNPLRLTGAWRNPDIVSQLSPDSLNLREGCAVVPTFDGTSYSGSTEVGACRSNLRGSSYATSIVTVTPTELRSWDQGFDENGTQVWGATEGAYIFKKK